MNESDRPGALKKYLKRNPGISQVAVSDGKIIGAVLCGHEGRRGYLNHLAVSSEWRRKGIGEALAKACLVRLKRAGIPKCNLFIYSSAGRAKSFWENRGWKLHPELRFMQIKTK